MEKAMRFCYRVRNCKLLSLGILKQNQRNELISFYPPLPLKLNIFTCINFSLHPLRNRMVINVFRGITNQLQWYPESNSNHTTENRKSYPLLPANCLHLVPEVIISPQFASQSRSLNASNGNNRLFGQQIICLI